MDAKTLGLVIALIAAVASAIFFARKPKTSELPTEAATPIEQLAATSKQIEQQTLEQTTLKLPAEIWDKIDSYRQTRETSAPALTVSKTRLPTPTAADSLAAAKTVIADPAVAKVVSGACPVRSWEVDYFNKTTRLWDKVYVNAVVSTEAISAAKASIGSNGALFSADAV